MNYKSLFIVIYTNIFFIFTTAINSILSLGTFNVEQTRVIMSISTKITYVSQTRCLLIDANSSRKKYRESNFINFLNSSISELDALN